jgi:hypothetical protein
VWHLPQPLRCLLCHLQVCWRRLPDRYVLCVPACMRPHRSSLQCGGPARTASTCIASSSGSGHRRPSSSVPCAGRSGSSNSAVLPFLCLLRHCRTHTHTHKRARTHMTPPPEITAHYGETVLHCAQHCVTVSSADLMHTLGYGRRSKVKLATHRLTSQRVRQYE